MQNLTVRLDTEVVRRAKILAAKRSTSISRLVADQIRALTEEDDEYELAMAEALGVMEAGFNLGGAPYPGREDLYDRAYPGVHPPVLPGGGSLDRS